jgi:SAM-dependent methyltransferase
MSLDSETVTLAGRDLIPVAFALAAAHERGVLAALAAAPSDVTALAQALRLDRRALSLVLELLDRFDLVEHGGDGRFALAPSLRAAARATPGGLAAERGLWARLDGFLGDGAPITEIDAGEGGRAAVYAGVVTALGAMWSPAAARLAERLAGHGPRVLDVGCGSGVWGLALAAARAGVRVTGLDLDRVLPSFRERARALGLADRADTIAGDAHRVPLDEGRFDVALIANVLRLEAPARAAALVARVATAVKPGGQLVVIDALAEGSADADRNRAVYALHLGLRTRDGRVHARAEIECWLRDAGLAQVEALDLGDVPGAVAGLRAWRPA